MMNSKHLRKLVQNRLNWAGIQFDKIAVRTWNPPFAPKKPGDCYCVTITWNPFADSDTFKSFQRADLEVFLDGVKREDETVGSIILMLRANSEACAAHGVGFVQG